MTLTRRYLALAISVPLLALTLTATANEVYKWKDAKGVTHYGDVPPPSARATRSTVKTKARTTAPIATVDNPQCVTARTNLTVLKGKGPVGIDNDKDGKPDTTMGAAERAKQTAYAQAGVDAYCTAPLTKPRT